MRWAKSRENRARRDARRDRVGHPARRATMAGAVSRADFGRLSPGYHTSCTHSNAPAPLDAEATSQSQRIARRLDLGVVVEVDENVAAGVLRAVRRRSEPGVVVVDPLAPVLDPLRPPLDRRHSIAAHIEFAGPVQADVHESGGGVLQERPTAGGVGAVARPVAAGELRDNRGIDTALVPNLESVP